jgi:hypothetical protein
VEQPPAAHLEMIEEALAAAGDAMDELLAVTTLYVLVTVLYVPVTVL